MFELTDLTVLVKGPRKEMGSGILIREEEEATAWRRWPGLSLSKCVTILEEK